MLALLLAATSSLASFQEGDIYLLSRALPNVGAGILRIDPHNGQTSLFKSFPDVRAFTYDSFRDALVVITGTNTGELRALDAWGDVTDLIAPERRTPVLVAARGDGLIYMYGSGEQRLQYMDQQGNIQNLVGAPPRIGAEMTQLFFHPETNALFIAGSSLSDFCSGTPDRSCVVKIPLNEDGTAVDGDLKSIERNVSSSVELPSGLSYGPKPLLGPRQLFLSVDTNRNDIEPRMLTFDPYSMGSLATFATPGNFAGAAGLGAGVYTRTRKLGLMVDTGNNVVRAFEFTGGGEGADFATGVSAGGCCEITQMLEIGRDANFGSQLPVSYLGGVRASVAVPHALPSGTKVLVDGEEAADVVVRNSAEGSLVFFTPPPYAGDISEVVDEISVDVEVLDDYLALATFEDALVYVADPVEGFDATRMGLRTYVRELIDYEDSAGFLSTMPKVGAIAEVILHGLVRSEELTSDDEDLIAERLQGLLHEIRDEINDNAPESLDHRAVVQPLTAGQTFHSPLAQSSDTVALTLATGTLLLTTSEMVSAPNTDGRFVFPSSWAQGSYTEPVSEQEALGWRFNVHVDPFSSEIDGVHITDLNATRPATISGGSESLQYVARRLSVPSIRATVNGETRRFTLGETDLSHIYIASRLESPHPKRDEAPEQWLMTAVFRLNLDGSALEHNVAKPALVVRQSYGFTEPHEEFEPTHAVQTVHAFPRVSFSVSDPNGDGPLVTDVEVLHRLATSPQADASPNRYVAGLFKDKDDVDLWLPLPCGAICFAAPLWSNLFEPATLAPVRDEGLYDTNTFDNLHIHRVHPDVDCPWATEPIVEAPGSFDGTIHCHWRWGSDYGSDFGNGQLLHPENQTWRVALAGEDFPLDPSPDLETVIAERLDQNGGVPPFVLDSEKVVVVSCKQQRVVHTRQYETFSTGFSFAVGPTGGFCALADALSQFGGYCAIQAGFEDGQEQLLAAVRNTSVVLGLFSSICSLSQGMPRQVEEEAICTEVTIPGEQLGAEVPLSLTAGSHAISISADGSGSSIRVSQNVFTQSFGFSVTEPLGTTGSAIMLEFEPPVRSVDELPIAVRDVGLSATVEIDVVSDGTTIDTVDVFPKVPPGGTVAEAIARIDPGQHFDSLVLRAQNGTSEFALGGFQICSDVVEASDLNRDGMTDLRDFELTAMCFAGPGAPLADVCLRADFDGDRDVDCTDVQALAATGPEFDILLEDCNNNGVPDGCDLAAGTLEDADNNGLPDICPPTPVALSGFRAITSGADVLLSWEVAAGALAEIAGITVQRSSSAAGPFVDITPSVLQPREAMEYADRPASGVGELWYRLLVQLTVGAVETVGPTSVWVDGAWTTRLYRPIPRGNGRAEIRYTVGEESLPVIVAIYDVRGRQIHQLDEGTRAPGEYRASWDGRDQGGRAVARGLYVVELQGGDTRLTEKLVLLR